MASGGIAVSRPNGSFVQPSVLLGAACLLLHLIINNRYALFSDELYFIVCGQHPALGYVDQPPLVPLIAAGSHALFGTALLPFRLIPALSMSFTVALTAELAKVLGGGRFSQWLSGLAVLFGGVLLVDGLLMTTDMMQPLTWLGCGWCLVRLAQTRDERWWLAFGAIVGISLASKYLIVFYLAGLAVGVLATPLRASLTKPWLYLGALIALILASPSVYWQASHGWPFLELGQAGAHGKNLVFSPLGFFGQQVLFIGPLSAPIWIAGLWRFSARPALPHYRVFPVAYVVMLLLFYFMHGKAYYLAPIYPVLLAGGALVIEETVRRPVWRGVILGVLAVAGIGLAPIAMPILPPNLYAPYTRVLGMSPAAATATERGPQAVLPLHLAGMFGWREMAAKVAAVYKALPPDQKAKAVFFGRDYSEASAVNVYGPAYGGPHAISGHNNYFLWGPRGYDGSVVITVGGDAASYARAYRQVQVVGAIASPFAEAFETHIPIYLLRDPRMPLSQIWPRLKHYE